MSPRSLSALKHTGELTITPLAISENAAFARHFALIVGAWNHVENGLGALLAKLIGTEPAKGVAIYIGLKAVSARQAVIRSAAKASLGEEDMSVLTLIFQELNAVQQLRNLMVHNLWAESKDLPGHLLLVPQQDWLGFRTQARVAVEYPAWFHTPPPGEMLSFANIQVYTIDDLERVFRRIDEVINNLGWFRELIGNSSPHREESLRILKSRVETAR